MEAAFQNAVLHQEPGDPLYPGWSPSPWGTQNLGCVLAGAQKSCLPRTLSSSCFMLYWRQWIADSCPDLRADMIAL